MICLLPSPEGKSTQLKLCIGQNSLLKCLQTTTQPRKKRNQPSQPPSRTRKRMTWQIRFHQVMPRIFWKITICDARILSEQAMGDSSSGSLPIDYPSGAFRSPGVTLDGWLVARVCWAEPPCWWYNGFSRSITALPCLPRSLPGDHVLARGFPGVSRGRWQPPGDG